MQACYLKSQLRRGMDIKLNSGGSLQQHMPLPFVMTPHHSTQPQVKHKGLIRVLQQTTLDRQSFPWTVLLILNWKALLPLVLMLHSHNSSWW